MGASTRWNVVPTLTLPGGQVAGQSQALIRYLGKMVKVDGASLTPEKPEDALVVDEVLSFVGEDMWRALLTVVGEIDAEARAEALLKPEGKVTLMLEELEKNILGSSSVLPEQLSTADVYIFCAFGWWASGFMTKLVTTEALLGGRPKLSAIVDRVGQLPQVRAYYSAEAKKKLPLAHVYQQFS